MNKPTDAQVKEFWEWCGWYRVERSIYSWADLNDEKFLRLPPIDLNNLFKYAVSKLLGDYYIDIKDYKLGWSVSLGDKLGNRYTCDNKDPALALFWTIWEAIK